MNLKNNPYFVIYANNCKYDLQSDTIFNIIKKLDVTKTPLPPKI